MTKVFIDGSAGTTGLRIYERLSGREDLELLILPDELRKNPDARRQMLSLADIAFLCLPDKAAIEAVSLIENDHVAVIDTSTAHRTNDDWAYGFAELSPATGRPFERASVLPIPAAMPAALLPVAIPWWLTVSFPLTSL